MPQQRRRSMLSVLMLLSACCAGTAYASAAPATLNLTSADFAAGGAIPARHSCAGADQSPALSWSAVPSGTRSFALIVDDPDAPSGTWVHWVVYDVPGDTRTLGASVPKDETLSDGAKQGTNDFRAVGYNGPCPPPGKPHRYFFTLYALDAPTGLKPRASKADVLRVIEGHVLGRGELVGTYQR